MHWMPEQWACGTRTQPTNKQCPTAAPSLHMFLMSPFCSEALVVVLPVVAVEVVVALAVADAVAVLVGVVVADVVVVMVAVVVEWVVVEVVEDDVGAGTQVQLSYEQ
mmetsp:Transcript_48181/g.153771  ORF Transcript_48181/g.153771 Transcript_48181/m.153771 type:complete len:107 (-) Transcript_48181:226-546(-)